MFSPVRCVRVGVVHTVSLLFVGLQFSVEGMFCFLYAFRFRRFFTLAGRERSPVPVPRSTTYRFAGSQTFSGYFSG